LGKAAEIASDETMNNYQPIKSLRVHLENELLKIPGTQINGSPENRLPNTLNMSFSGISSSDLIKAFADKIAVATGSACTSALPEPSHVLKAMGVPDERAYASIRFSLGKYTTPEEIDETIRIVRSVVSSR
jgi:cysteine desulfurase